MNSPIKSKIPIGKLIVQIFTWILAISFLAPFVLFFLNAFKDKDHIFDTFYVPSLTYLLNFEKVFKSSPFFQSLGITVIICFFTLVFVVLFSSMAGYMISRTKRKIISMIYILFAAGQIIPAQTGMIPIYKIGVSTHLINTIPFLIIINIAGGSAFGSLFFAGFTKTVPEALEESAYIDGCGRFQSFFRIIFPLLKPAAATIVCTTIYWYWNDFQGPLIYLNTSKYAPLMMTVYNFKGTNNETDWGPVYALCLLSAVPMIIFFLFTQNYLLKGLVVGSVKG